MRNMKLAHKMGLLVAVAVLFVIMVGTVGNLTTKQMASESGEIYNDSLLPLSWLRQIQTNERSVDAYTLELMLSKDSTAKQATLKNIQTLLQVSDGLIKKYQASLADASGQTVLTQYLKLQTQFREAQSKAGGLALSGDQEAAYTQYVTNTGDLREQMTKLLSQLADQAQEAADSMYHRSELDAKTNNVLTLTMTLVAILLLIVIAWMLTRLITKPLRTLQEQMMRAARGDMTVQGTYQSRDEIGQLNTSFNRMITGIHELVGKANSGVMTLNESSNSLAGYVDRSAAASEQIAISATRLAAGFGEQSRTLQALSDSTTEMAELLAGMEEGSRFVQGLSQAASAAGHRGMTAVEAVIWQMNEISSSVRETHMVIEKLSDQSDTIGSIVTTIDEIANQTNLLALNATIEAARAGEAGRGFAVVSGEIRNLADAASQSSRRIAEIIKGIQEQTRIAVRSMNQGTQRVLTGVERSGQAADAFREIEQSIHEVTFKLEEVGASAASARAESQQVAGSMQLFNRISLEGTEGLEEMSAASEGQNQTMNEVAHAAAALKELAQELQEALGKFAL